MPFIWLRVAVVCYGVGLLYSLLLLSKKGNLLAKVVEPAVGLGLIFHFVSLVESTVLIGHCRWPPSTIPNRILAFLAMVVFFIFFVGYRTTSPGIVIFPIVFLLTFASAIGQKPVTLTSPLLRSGWIFVHVVLIFTGYAGLFLSFGASLLYLVQERALKSEAASGCWPGCRRCRPSTTSATSSLLFGFPFMTSGTGDGLGAGHREVRAAVLLRSQDFAVVHHVGGVHAVAVHPLEFGMARTPRGVSGDLCLCDRASAPGPPTTSAACTGLLLHELRRSSA